MKKCLLMVLGVLMLAPAAFADNWGLGLKLGVGENDPKSLDDVYDAATFLDRELDKNGGFFGVEAMYEWNLASEMDKIGVRLGVDFYGENELELKNHFDPTDDDNYKETTYAIPLTVYYKRDNGVNKLSYFAGVGLTFISSEVEDDIVDESIDDNKVFPHIVAGVEYRFTQVFALGLEAKYNISAKVKKDGIVLSDRSGFSGALTGRFYF
ncbi:MAG TPA: porin family protein [Candidatus Avelusimicrobium excrementipullorum]|nr:porin family protein [Candidatus Avelusimicrobium excrementipullorum]